MPAEAAISVTVKNARGDLITLRGDSPAEFFQHATALLGEAESLRLLESVKASFRAVLPAQPTPQPALTVVPDEAQAVANVVNAFPGASTVGQPLPQPTAPAAPVQGEVAGGEAPPQPGELRTVNGEIKKWIPAGVSKAGKPYKGFWGKP